MYHEYTQEELRAYCRSCIESLEVWARRLIHEKMTEKFGEEYIAKTLPGGAFLIKKEIREHIFKMQTQNPGRFSRPVDTLFIDQVIYFLCKKEWYDLIFKEALDFAYPQGCEEAREFLSRLVPIRNSLSHSNSISIRQVEQAICYSHDFVEGLKRYYREKGEEQVYNVPRIIRVSDSLGNVFDVNNETSRLGVYFSVPQKFNCGDKYSVEIEIDSSFSEDEYNIRWETTNHDTKKNADCTKFTIELLPQDVGMSTFIECIVTQKKEWHRFGSHDSRIVLSLIVLPPVE